MASTSLEGLAIGKYRVLEALGRHHRVPVARFGEKQLDTELVSRLPAVIARMSGVVPLSYDRKMRKLSIAVKDPSDLTTIQTIRRLYNCDVQVFQGDPAEIDRLLQKHYTEPEIPAGLPADELQESLVAAI